MATIYDLPKPALHRLQTSDSLLAHIKRDISQHQGYLPFADFMKAALYHPEWGYYNAQEFALGKQGDFTTAPELSPLFAACFARQCQQIFTTLSGDILELGAGSGIFARDLIVALETLHALPAHYYIYEISPALREKQQHFLKNSYPKQFHRFIWLEALPASFTGVIIANEVLDALPVDRFRIEQDGIKERCISLDQDHLCWQSCTPITPGLAEKVRQIQAETSLPIGYESEICLHLEPLVQTLANSLTQGIILLADYGYGRLEYYHPQRHRGTLTCFYQHHRHEDPLFLPGLQDITAHVDFTRVIEVAADHGCALAGYTTQAAFLFGLGLMDLAAECEKNQTPTEALELHQAIKSLTLPTEMGEVIKVMALSKKLELPLLGFQWQDRRRDL